MMLLGCFLIVLIVILRSAYQQIQLKDERIITLESDIAKLMQLNQQHNALIAELQAKQIELVKTYTTRRQTIKRAINDNQSIKDWANINVPDDIKRLLKHSKN